MKDFLKWVAYGAVFVVPFVLLIVSSSMFFPFITGKNFAFRIVVEVGVAAWLLLALYDKTYRPKLSYILYAILGLLGVMFIANMFGEYAPKSFWSNYERMEGWVTLVHFFFYFLMVGSLINTAKLWRYFLNVTLVAGYIMTFYALGQVLGWVSISQGGEGAWRVDGRLGNSSYLGVYMLFHIFIAGWLYLDTKRRNLKIFYVLSALLFAYILTQTGTRGTLYGLIGGSILAFLYLAIMAKKGALIKKIALGGLVAVVLVVLGMWSLRHTEFVQNNPMLNRFAGVSLAEGNIRFMVWGMALEGVKEHPILGWGQENFNYVFSKYYDPGMYGAEPWYDRTHNIFLDWLIAGGALGLLAYLSVLSTALWYAVIKPVYQNITKKVADETFTVYEQALILGTLAAYMFHNLFVFDSLASWIFYAVLLALIHSRVSRPWSRVEQLNVDIDIIDRIAVPVVLVVAGVAVYYVNVPSMLAAQDIIEAYKASSADARLAKFEQALARGGFAEQEIFEHLSQAGVQVLGSTEVTTEQKTAYYAKFIEESDRINQEKPGDARLHIISGGVYRSVGDLDKALNEFKIAEALSPTKQAILEDEGLTYLLANKKDEAIERYTKSYELDTANLSARVRLAMVAMYFDDTEMYQKLLPTEELAQKGDLWHKLIEDQQSLQLAYRKQNLDLMKIIFEGRLELDPSDRDSWINLASVYAEKGDYSKAREVLNKAIEVVPALKTDAQNLLDRIDELDNHAGD